MVQYRTTVEWDSSLVDVMFADSLNTVTKGLAIGACKITSGAPSAVAGVWLPGALVQNVVTGINYQNKGTTAAPVWYAVTTA